MGMQFIDKPIAEPNYGGVARRVGGGERNFFCLAITFSDDETH